VQWWVGTVRLCLYVQKSWIFMQNDPIILATFDTTPSPHRMGESMHLVYFWPSPTSMARRERQLWASAVQWWVGTVRVYRVTKRFTTSGFDTLLAFFEHLLQSPIADFDEASLLDYFHGGSPETDELDRLGFIVNQGIYIFIKVEEKVIPPVLDFAVNVPIRSPQVFYAFWKD
jgi:hypothetical protein